MAIGLGRMFGFRFPENFRWPYLADTMPDFWRRWHISLSAWFRDYLYVPLGGSRVSPTRTYMNLVSLFFLCGLWHGASWNFVIWGAVSRRISRVRTSDRLAGRVRRPSYTDSTGGPGPFGPGALLCHVYLLLVVMSGWVFFRAPTLPGALAFFKALAGHSAAAPTPLYRAVWYLTSELWLSLTAGASDRRPLFPFSAAGVIESGERRRGRISSGPSVSRTRSRPVGGGRRRSLHRAEPQQPMMKGC